MRGALHCAYTPQVLSTIACRRLGLHAHTVSIWFRYAPAAHMRARAMHPFHLPISALARADKLWMVLTLQGGLRGCRQVYRAPASDCHDPLQAARTRHELRAGTPEQTAREGTAVGTRQTARLPQMAFGWRREQLERATRLRPLGLRRRLKPPPSVRRRRRRRRRRRWRRWRRWPMRCQARRRRARRRRAHRVQACVRTARTKLVRPRAP